MKILHKKPGIKGAFTLIELLVVISIIGLLSSVVLVSLQSARAKAVNARILQEAGQLRNSFELGRTNTGYTSLSSSGSSGIAAYGSMSTEMQGLVNDILKQQGKTIATLGAYPGGSAGCSAPLSQTGAEGVIVTTEATACGTTPTGYAIYAANSPVGTAGYTCIDSKGGRGSETIGGIVLNSTNGVCSGTVSGGGGPSNYSVMVTADNAIDGPFDLGSCTLSISGMSTIPCATGSISVTSGSHTVTIVQTGSISGLPSGYNYIFNDSYHGSSIGTSKSINSSSDTLDIDVSNSF